MLHNNNQHHFISVAALQHSHHSASQEATFEFIDEAIRPGYDLAEVINLMRLFRVIQIPAASCGANRNVDGFRQVVALR